MAATDGSGIETLLVKQAHQHVPQLAVTLGLANLVVLAGLIGYAILYHQPLWTLFRSEYSLATWFSSVQLVLLALLAYTIYCVLELSRRQRGLPVRHRWVWALVAAGFVVLALDERFEFHAMLRDHLFRPAGLWADSAWFIPGDVGLHLFFVIGLLFTPFLLGELRQARKALPLFVLALLLTFVVLLIDSLNDSTMYTWPAWRFWDYTFEEMGEIWAELLFLLAFLRVLERRLGDLTTTLTR